MADHFTSFQPPASTRTITDSRTTAPYYRTTVLPGAVAAKAPSNVPMLAERFGADAGRIAQVVLSTTVVAFATFPLVLGLLK